MSAKYVAIITDGNGRWAQQRGLPVVEGHRAGADTVKERLRDAVELGIEELTVYSFSTENWTRPPEEVEGLMAMFGERIDRETPELKEEGVRMRFIGRREGIGPELTERMDWAERETADNERITLFVAFNYGGRAEIMDAARAFHGGDEDDFRRGPLRPRDARPRPADPDQRRAAHLELPALAVRLLRVRLQGRALARLQSGRLRGRAAHLRRAPAALRSTVMDDLDPPSFQFGRGRRERDPEEALLPDPDEILDEPVEEAEPQPEDRGTGLRRFLPQMSETTSRVVVAIPWVIFAIAIVGIGGEVFAFSMIAFAVLALREFFRMAAGARPIMLPAYAVVAGMVIAAHYGGSFQILLVFAALFPATYAFAAARQSHAQITISIAMTALGVAWLGLGFSHAVLLRDLPDSRRRSPDRRPRRHLPRRHRRLRRRATFRQPQDHPTDLAQQDPRGPDRGLPRRHDGLLVCRPLPGLAAGDRRPADGDVRSP